MKIVCSLLQEFGSQLTGNRMQQLLFLYCTEAVQRDEYYEFIPISGLPYSVQAAADRQHLINKNILEKSDGWQLRQAKKRYAAELDFFEKIAIQDVKNAWLDKSDEALQQYIKEGYPQFAEPRPANNEAGFYTIGYEGVLPEGYINALLAKGVKLLVDVRRNAYSQKYGFSKAELASILPQVGIAYQHMPELGIESEKRQELNTPQDYAALFKEYEQTTLQKQQAALDRLQALLGQHQHIAITCFEADPHCCHRSRVAGALKARDNFTYNIEHIEPCKQKMKRTNQNVRESS